MNKQINELKIFLISFDLTLSDTSTKILRNLSHIGLRKDSMNILIILFSASDSLMRLIKIIVLLRYHAKINLIQSTVSY